MNKAKRVRKLSLTSAAVAAVLMGACGHYSDESPYAGAGNPPPPPNANLRVPLLSAWAFVNAATSRVFFVNGHGGVPKARPVSVGRAPVAAQQRVGQDQLLVLTQGVVGARGVKEEAPALWLVPAAEAGVRVQVVLDTRYNTFAQSPDGRFVVLFFSGAPTSVGQVAFTPNQLAVVDLQAPVPMPTKRTVPSLGGVPTGIDFSPPLALPDGVRSLAVVRADNYITLLDLQHPERGEISIPLTLPDDNRVLKPSQILFDAAGPGVFLRASGSEDIFSIRLTSVPVEERQVGQHDFRPVLSQLAAGRAPTDMMLYDAGQGLRLLVAGADRTAFVIDPASSLSVQIPLEHDVSAIVPWRASLPDGSPGKAEAILIAATAAKATFIDLPNLETLKTRNLEVVNLPDVPISVQNLAAEDAAVMMHKNQSFSLLHFAGRSVTPLTSAVGIKKLVYSPQVHTLWLTTPTERLGFIQFVGREFMVAEVRLDAPAENLLVSAQEPDGKPKLLVEHLDAAGYVTAVDAIVPTRASARSIRGFVATGLLNLGEGTIK